MISKSIRDINARIQAAAERVGRIRDDIQLVAVTKTVSADHIEESLACGINIIGENRVQEARAKAALITRKVSWHLVGHLQTNKAKKAVQFFDMIQSLDSVRLGDAVNTYAGQAGKIMECLVEVNIGGEEAKHGITPDDVDAMLSQAVRWPHILIKGLMTIAPFFDDPEKSRPFFIHMKQVFDQAKKRQYSGVHLDILSMGMSGDFEVAIEEGSTMVRIGTAIFGERPTTSPSHQ